MTEQSMIQIALNKWREINSDKNCWATFECVRFPNVSACAVKFGSKNEIDIQTIVYKLYDNGQYYTNHVTHL